MSRDELGASRREASSGWAPPDDDPRDGASDLDAPVRPAPDDGAGTAASGAAGARASRGRRAVAVVLAAALAAGGFALGQRSAAAPAATTSPSTGREDFLGPGPQGRSQREADLRDPGPTAYAELFPSEDDRRRSTVVVSWAGVRDLELDLRVVVAVVTDDRTRVDGARLGGGPVGSTGVGLDRGDLARAVLVAAGEPDAGDVPVAHVRRTSGTVAVELVDEGYDLTVATAPRVHLAVVQGTTVLQMVAVPLAGPRPRA